MVSLEQTTIMADQLGWSIGPDGFPDLGPDLLSTNTFDSNSFDDIDGKLFTVNFISTVFCVYFTCAADIWRGICSPLSCA